MIFHPCFLILFLALGLTLGEAIKVTETAGKLAIETGEAVFYVNRNLFSVSAVRKEDDLFFLTDINDQAYALGFGVYKGKDFTDSIYEGYSFRIGAQVMWWSAEQVLSWEQRSEDEVVLTVSSSCKLGTQFLLSVKEDADKLVSLSVSLKGDVPEGVNRVGLGFGAANDKEGFFGFGERFDEVNHRSLPRYVYVEDGGWSLNHFDPLRLPKGPGLTYVPMPWLFSSEGYGLLLDTTFRSNWDLGAEVFQKEGEEPLQGYRFEVENNAIDKPLVMRFFLGPSTREVLSQFTAFTGRSLIPALFQFGPWNQFSNEIEDMHYEEAIEAFIDMDIPISVGIIGTHFFPKGSQHTKYRELAQQNLFSRAHGLKTTAYFNSMVDTEYFPVYDECEALGIFVKNADNTTYNFAYKGAARAPFYCALLDFTHPDTASWYGKQFEQALDVGFSGWMYDYGEYLSQSTVLADGTPGHEAHNAYPVQYQRMAFDFFKNLDKDPEDDYAPPYVYYVRSGYTGTGGAVWNHWTGDPMCDWSENSGIKAQVKAMLSIGLSGVPFSGSDVGGFVWTTPPSEELWIRWAQLGLWSATLHTQTGGTSMLGIPKTHIMDTPQGTAIWRRIAKLRTSLLPYTYSAAHVARFEGIPIMRQHVLDFPSDEEAREQKYQFMFGPSLLSAPVLDEGATAWDVYLPRFEANEDGETKWIDVASAWQFDTVDGRFRIGYSASLEGGQTVTVDAPLETSPLFVKSGSILPLFDSTLDTVNEVGGFKKLTGLVTLSDVEQVVHLWVFPNEASMEAKINEGPSFDGLQATLSPEQEESSSLVLSVEDQDKKRTVIAQLALEPSKLAALSSVQFQGQEDGAFTQVSSYHSLVTTSTRNPSLGKAFAVDEQQSVVWIRANASLFENGSFKVILSFN